MRGHIRRKPSGAWELIFDGDPIVENGIERRNRKYITFQGTKEEAEKKLTSLMNGVNEGTFIEPEKLTVGEWLALWFENHREGVKIRTRETYLDVIENHLVPGLGALRLQKLTSIQIEGYFNAKRKEKKRLSESTLAMHQALLHKALSSAKKKKFVHENQAALVDGKPKRRSKATVKDDVKANCWERDEAKRFLEVARKAGPQQAAFYTVAITLGLRKAELCGLKWEDIDFEAGKLTVARQLVKMGFAPTFGTPKSDSGSRIIDISTDAVKLLAEHKRHQAEIKMRHRDTYRDHGLVFAKEEGTHIGCPLQMNNLGEREFAALVKLAEVRRIKFHGLRHTSATLALNAGVPLAEVSAMLGHAKSSITLDIYYHAIESEKKSAAETMAALLR